MRTQAHINAVQDGYAKACREYDEAWMTHDAVRAAYRQAAVDREAFCTSAAAVKDALGRWEVARAAWERLSDAERGSVGLRSPVTPAQPSLPFTSREA